AVELVERALELVTEDLDARDAQRIEQRVARTAGGAAGHHQDRVDRIAHLAAAARIGPAAAAQDAAVGGPLAERQGEAGHAVAADGRVDGQLGAGDLLGAEGRRGAREVYVVERVVADLVA